MVRCRKWQFVGEVVGVMYHRVYQALPAISNWESNTQHFLQMIRSSGYVLILYCKCKNFKTTFPFVSNDAKNKYEIFSNDHCGCLTFLSDSLSWFLPDFRTRGGLISSGLQNCWLGFHLGLDAFESFEGNAGCWIPESDMAGGSWYTRWYLTARHPHRHVSFPSSDIFQCC